jgi:hypothetical protein
MMESRDQDWRDPGQANTVFSGYSIQDDETGVSPMIATSTVTSNFDHSVAVSMGDHGAANDNGLILGDGHIEYEPPRAQPHVAVFVRNPSSPSPPSTHLRTKDVPSVIYVGDENQPQTVFRLFGLGSGDTMSIGQRSFVQFHKNRRFCVGVVVLLLATIIFSTDFITLSFGKNKSSGESENYLNSGTGTAKPGAGEEALGLLPPSSPTLIPPSPFPTTFATSDPNGVFPDGPLTPSSTIATTFTNAVRPSPRPNVAPIAAAGATNWPFFGPEPKLTSEPTDPAIPVSVAPVLQPIVSPTSQPTTLSPTAVTTGQPTFVPYLNSATNICSILSRPNSSTHNTTNFATISSYHESSY